MRMQYLDLKTLENYHMGAWNQAWVLRRATRLATEPSLQPQKEMQSTFSAWVFLVYKKQKESD